MDEIDPKSYGWKTSEEDNMLVPLWFTGRQFPPCLQKSPRGKKNQRSSPKGSKVRRKRRLEESSEGELADGELSDNSVPIPEIEVAVPVDTICYIQDDADTEENMDYGEETIDSESSYSDDWGDSSLYASSDSGSDSEWAP